jgi:regulator of cell morphogenesis and NO signaling
MNFNDWNLDFLADFIVNTHHAYVRKSLPEMRGYALKVAGVHGDRHPELLTIRQLVEEIAEELTSHMETEETILFPYIKRIVAARGSNESVESESSLAELIATMESEHNTVGRALEEIRKQSRDFAIPEDACASYKVLYKMIEEFESDLFTHIHLENNILFPKALEMEKGLPVPALS